ncbi:MAG: alpha/beta fold hydrolase [Desulfuromonadales bacterium]|nr:alpha/beta fold hydrolase [Desulfuromonadales bacterium]
MLHNRWLRRVLLLVLLVSFGYAMPLHAFLEKSFLFFPTSDLTGTPATVGLDYREVAFAASDGQPLAGWLIPGQEGAPVVVFCMGNYGNMSHRLDNLRLLHQLGVSLFIFDYRGYGQSGGNISEAGSYADLRGAVVWLAEQGFPPPRTILFGRSLGAAIALEVALGYRPAGLILEAPFSSIRVMGLTHYPLLYRLLGWLFDAEYDNLGKIGRLQSPLLILHGDRDTICPPAMAEQLYQAAPSPKRLEWLRGAGHNDTLVVGGARYLEIWREFLGGLGAETGG